MAATISIVIPAYNEATRLPGTLKKIDEYASTGEVAIAEVIVVDDGSRDETAKIPARRSTKVRVRVVSYGQNSGKGYAIRRGIIEAKGDLVLISDADLSTPVSEVVKLTKALESFDIAIGSRAVDRSLVRVSQAWYRDRGGRVINVLMKCITGMPYNDTQCGFKLLPADVAREIAREAVVDGFAWGVEYLLLAGRLGFSVTEVPVLWFNAPGSKVSLFRDPLKMLWDMLRLRLRLGAFQRVAPGTKRVR